MPRLDDTDRRILGLLQENARISNAEISRRIGLAASAVYERIRKMEQRGVILGHHTHVAPGALGLGLMAYVYVKSKIRVARPDTGARLGRIPGVQEVHHIAGEDCFIVKVRAPDTDTLGRILQEEFHAIESVEATKTTIVLGTVTETPALPVYPTRVETVDA